MYDLQRGTCSSLGIHSCNNAGLAVANLVFENGGGALT